MMLVKGYHLTRSTNSATCWLTWTIWRTPAELRALASWKAHTLTGNRKETWSLSVTANLRLTFRVDVVENEIYDPNLEDYH
jgi:plasmid maintenance system killer protein